MIDRHPNIPLFLWIPALLLSLAVFPAAAHNGRAALAYPLADIAIDGDLSDWPEGMVRHPIELTELGDLPRDRADFQAAFRIGYSAAENALYLAVEVEDESSVTDTAPVEVGWGDWNQEDGCEVFLDLAHQESRGPVFMAVIYGEDRKMIVEPGTQAWEHVELGVQRVEGIHRYEWKLDINGISEGKVRLGPALSVGVDVAVGDRDADGSFTWTTWCREVNKNLSSERLGDAVLVAPQAPIGRLSGKVRWEGREQGVARRKVRLQSPAVKELWACVETDREGNFAAALPARTYLARLNEPDRAGVEVELSGARESRVELVAPLPRGISRPAGKGKTARSGPGIREGEWHFWGVPDGLLSFDIQALCQDRRGNLWVGTRSGGVSRYDGETFTTFTSDDGLPGNTVSSILEDRNGNLWFAIEDEGVSRYDGETFTTFTSDDGLPGNTVSAILEDRDGNLWFGTDFRGVSRYDGETFTTFTSDDGLPGNTVSAILEDRDGNLWFAGFSGASRYDGERFTDFTTADGLPTHWVRSMLEDRNGNLWFGTNIRARDFSTEESSFLCRRDGEECTSFKMGDVWGFPTTEASSMTEDPRGHLWFGAGNSQVAYFDGKHFTQLRLGTGNKGRVNALLGDREGNLWVGTGRGGLGLYEGQAFTTFTQEDGLGGHHQYFHVRCILEDREGNLWFGTPGGVSRFDGKAFTHFSKKDGLLGDPQSSFVGCIAEDREGHLWFGGSYGVSRFDGKTFTHFTEEDGLVDNQVQCILNDREGNLWFGTGRRGINRFDGREFTTFSGEKAGLDFNHVAALLEDRKGVLWFGTGNWGVGRFGGKGVTSFIMARDGLASNTVFSMLEDQEGNLWFGTAGGVTRFDGKTFRTFTPRDGLVHNIVQCMLQDREGALWFGTPGGVSRFDGQVWQSLLSQDGLPNDNIYDILQDRRGDIWIATDKGATRYHPPRTAPPVLLTDVVTDRRHGPVPKLRLPTTQNYLAFEFQGQSFRTRPDQMVYLYRLEGYDSDWQQTRERRVEYANLAPGEYLFQVKAVDRDLNYSATPVEVQVRVHLPYERIAWITTLILAILLIAWQTARIVRRDRKLQRVNQTLQQQTTDLEQTNRQLRDTQTQLVQAEKMTTLGLLAGGVAHELNNPLQALLTGSQRILRFPDDAERHHQSASLMERAAQHGSAIVQSLLNYTRRVREEVTDVDLNEVVDSTLSLLQHQLEQGDIDLKTTHGERSPIQGNFTELCTVVTNLVMNARDAALSAPRDDDRKPFIRIATAATPAGVVLTVCDSGPGIPPDLCKRIFDPFFTTKEVGAGTGLGLSIVQGIVERHSGSIEVESTEGQGTTFTVHLPARNNG